MPRGVGVLTAVMLSASVFAAPALATPAWEEGGYLAPFSSPLADAISPSEDEEAAMPAVLPPRMERPATERAVFVLEEAAAPFLGHSAGDSARVHIAIDAGGYQDLFTIHFPLGSAHVSLPAEDMAALAAEAARGLESFTIWVSAGDGTSPLAAQRIERVERILLENDVPADAIHLDDGSLEAILNRPARLANDLEI